MFGACYGVLLREDVLSERGGLLNWMESRYDKTFDLSGPPESEDAASNGAAEADLPLNSYPCQ